jgi:hypothetical protein
VYGHAVAGQDIPAVVVEEGRHEVHLDIGPVVGGMPADHEPAGLGDVRGTGALAAEQVAHPDHKIAELVVGDLLPAVNQRADVQVILQVLPDARQVVNRLDADGAQGRGRPDTG